MPPEETITPDTPQPTQESPTPAIEVHSPTIEPATPPQEASPEATAPVLAEMSPTLDSTSSPQAETAPASAEATAGTQPTTPTAQIPPNEPIASEPEPIETTPEPPSAAAPVPTGILHTAREFLGKARVAIQDRKRKKRDKIMQALTTKTKITNDEVEKLLHVSDATATRYLSALEKEGKIIQVGKQGKGILYIKTP